MVQTREEQYLEHKNKVEEAKKIIDSIREASEKGVMKKEAAEKMEKIYMSSIEDDIRIMSNMNRIKQIEENHEKIVSKNMERAEKRIGIATLQSEKEKLEVKRFLNQGLKKEAEQKFGKLSPAQMIEINKDIAELIGEEKIKERVSSNQELKNILGMYSFDKYKKFKDVTELVDGIVRGSKTLDLVSNDRVREIYIKVVEELFDEKIKDTSKELDNLKNPKVEEVVLAEPEKEAEENTEKNIEEQTKKSFFGRVKEVVGKMIPQKVKDRYDEVKENFKALQEKSEINNIKKSFSESIKEYIHREALWGHGTEKNMYEKQNRENSKVTSEQLDNASKVWEDEEKDTKELKEVKGLEKDMVNTEEIETFEKK